MLLYLNSGTTLVKCFQLTKLGKNLGKSSTIKLPKLGHEKLYNFPLNVLSCPLWGKAVLCGNSYCLENDMQERK